MSRCHWFLFFLSAIAFQLSGIQKSLLKNGSVRSRHKKSIPPGTPWTFLYKKVFSDVNSSEKILFEKVGIPLFSQLIFSWNAVRPRRGFFRFWGRVRDSQNGRWLSWHHMFDWGASVQRSFSRIGRGSSYYNVRLELQRRRCADGFQIKVEARDGASLDTVVALFVSVSRCDYFRSEGRGRVYADYDSCMVKNVPRYSQMTLDHPRRLTLCSPTSLSMVMAHALEEHVDVCSVADHCYDQGMDIFGCWQMNTAYAFNLGSGRFFSYVQRLSSFDELYNLLRAGIPVVVSVRGEIHGAPKPYPSGHLLVVRGFDGKRQRVICNDPACPRRDGVMRRYRLSDFLAAWERSFRLAYLVVPRD